MSDNKKIAIYASGGGSNAERIMEHFAKSDKATVALVLTNKQDAGVITKAEWFDVQVEVVSNEQARDGQLLVDLMSKHHIDFIALAGYLRKIPDELIQAFEDRMLNIHPSLLPKFGGKGMYGNRVHEAVIEAREVTSGITIHKVNENYDEGGIIFQADVLVNHQDTPESLQKKVLKLEHKYYPMVIEEMVRKL